MPYSLNYNDELLKALRTYFNTQYGTLPDLYTRYVTLNGSLLPPGPPSSGDNFLLEDGVSQFLLEDGTSFLLLE